MTKLSSPDMTKPVSSSISESDSSKLTSEAVENSLTVKSLELTNKKVAVMQPYFLPYIGYFQLISAVDEFIVYDNIQFSKKGWFHRNRMLQNLSLIHI